MEIYTNHRSKMAIIKKEKYKGIEYTIASCGLYPCAYLNTSNTPYKFISDENPAFDDFPCHGGVTYSWKRYPCQESEEEGVWFVGWDYAHSEDDYIFSHNPTGHKWTIEEIEGHCKIAIDYIRGSSFI